MDIEQLFLCKLAEECGEVIQLCMKAQQFGLDSIDPKSGLSNKELLHGELNDILGVVGALNIYNQFDFQESDLAKLQKHDKMLKYLKISQELGKVKEW